ncbi:MAG: His-Xaa-Ser system protein HxsD [Parcubacteria group bacterium]|mgnify:CR=1 FL=1|nr:His-Xaa-Ser system protein HxsD [Parcubacteria group bacterium]|tara:strand:- start:2034 stop:2444 length:411 start_codon:yes stop_codon:yes gene_type:complete
MVKIKDNTIKLVFDLQKNSLEAIYGAAYVFLDKAYLFLDSKNKNKIQVSLKSKKRLSSKKLEELRGEFLNEFLNYTVRINLAKYNKKIREYIISQALSSALTVEECEEDEVKYEDDPLGIAVPWEEKYQEDKKKGK